MPYKSAAQKKREKEKAKAKKKYAAAQREKAKNAKSEDEVAAERAERARQNREKTNVYRSVSEQNFDLASKVFVDNQRKSCIYIGKRSNATDEDYFMDAGFTHVLNCALEIPIPEFYAPNGIKFLHLECRDRTDFNLLDALDTGVEYIKSCMDERCTILVHCHEGKSRSTSMVTGYLIKYEGMRLNSALATISARRSMVQPNSAFLVALKEYEEQIHGPEVELEDAMENLTMDEA